MRRIGRIYLSIIETKRHEIEFDNLFYISSEPSNIQEYINKTIMEVRKSDRTLFRKGKDESSNQSPKIK
jgi:hypothetical protein